MNKVTPGRIVPQNRTDAGRDRTLDWGGKLLKLLQNKESSAGVPRGD